MPKDTKDDIDLISKKKPNKVVVEEREIYFDPFQLERSQSLPKDFKVHTQDTKYYDSKERPDSLSKVTSSENLSTFDRSVSSESLVTNTSREDLSPLTTSSKDSQDSNVRNETKSVMGKAYKGLDIKEIIEIRKKIADDFDISDPKEYTKQKRKEFLEKRGGAQH